MAQAAPISHAKAQAAGIISLPKPHVSGGVPLLDALSKRKSTREFAAKPLGLDLLADLLWAANGYNRPETKHRTAPTARNYQEMDVYVALESGTYLYDADTNQLVPIDTRDLRAATGEQDYVGSAPLNLVYVADLSRMKDSPDRTESRFYSAVDAGFIAQNVYLFCAARGLATVVRGLVPRARLVELMGLRPSQRIILAQSVGYPRS